MNKNESYIDAEAFLWEEDTIASREERRKTRKFRSRKCWLLPLLFLISLAVYVFGALPIGYDLPFLRKTATVEKGWNLILVNGNSYIPEDYDVELVTLSNGQKVDQRIYPDLQDMFDTMRSQGIYPVVASGYRTEAKQRQLLHDKIEAYEEKGCSWWTARKNALQWVSKPGTSEHQLGIAVDINQEGTRSTADQVYDWLEHNAHRFGFICRYPADKTGITGVSNEPWHYRYVGKEAAEQIYEQGICLEEYLR